MNHLKGQMCPWPMKLLISGFLYANPTACAGDIWFSPCPPLGLGVWGTCAKMLLAAFVHSGQLSDPETSCLVSVDTCEVGPANISFQVG